MNTQIKTLVSNSLASWENWNALGYEQRTRILTVWANSLDEDCKKMVTFQCFNAQEHLGETLLMPGPTGETNELYSAGRGTIVVTADDDTSAVAIVGQLTAALVNGNCVILCLSANSTIQAGNIINQLTLAGCPLHVVQTVEHEQLTALITNALISGVAFAGLAAIAQRLARQLAERDGLLAQLIAETDCIKLPVIGSPTYSMRFITERTRTINITAVGGNATLLELGSGEEH
ncbi:aldehyde dehydrogenase family protein [Photobacterium sanguinicancri]|uniref:aldehyde dehydrogenase family protein n=1 Tax=Photobacterium sanguinicancri TaxID=875932 RepID=UPI0026E28C97|nr:aldehyde dehydrogenase family protein [Photobacterium sanguinicancri]MDO6498365.1 aldehyde dehydrogenase family protein [Photobacterium sanguinicancri]